MKKRFIIIALSLLLIIILFLFVFSPIESIKDINQEPEIIILDSENNEMIHLINGNKTTPISLDKMNKKNIDILLNIEDKEFYKHSGFNILRIFKTIFSNLKNNSTAGASTITQQYVKNVYLNTEKKLSRKLKELYYSIKLEQIASKDEILTGYLNSLYFGNNVYGIADAAKYYFNKDYSNLSINEMTILVAMINAPSYYSNNLDKLEIRKKQLLNVLYKNNILTQKEYAEAYKTTKYNFNKELYNSNLLYFTDELLKEFKSLEIKAKFNQKITIATNYNTKMNDIKFNSSGDYAAMAVDKNGFIISMIGNKDYSSSSFNIVTKGNRDIGSTIKPLLYYEAIKCGFNKQTKYYSAPYSLTFKDTKITINNFASIYSYEYINMKQALATSDNIYAIKTHQALGFKTLVNHLKKYGIEAESLPSLALGSIGMSLYDLTKIYSQFFTEGKYYTFKYITKLYIDDKLKYTAIPKYKILGNSTYFKEIKELMNSVFDPTIPHSTCGYLSSKLNSKCYGKSGLTDYDSYMIGFNDDILVSVWAGYLDNKELTANDIKRLPKEIFLKLINT